MASTENNSSENVTLRFIVQITQHPIFKEPYKLYVVGNIDELGNWNPHEGIEMPQVSEERLEASIIISKNIQKIIEYKYVNITKNGAQVNWEHGENRTIRQIDSEFLQIQDQFRVSYTKYCCDFRLRNLLFFLLTFEFRSKTSRVA
jgi:hypothetical protein